MNIVYSVKGAHTKKCTRVRRNGCCIAAILPGSQLKTALFLGCLKLIPRVPVLFLNTLEYFVSRYDVTCSRS
jgi:hypothetical protein